MTHEVYIKRTVYTAKCNCGKEDALNETLVANPPRERVCNACGEWVPFVEVNAIAPEYKAKQPFNPDVYNVTYR